MFRNLLVHVDGGKAGRRRVQFAVDLATRTGARLTGLHVTPPAEVPPRYKPSLVDEVAAELSSKLALGARAAATIFSEEATQRLADTCRFKEHEALGRQIEQGQYDLLVMGGYSHPIWPQFIFGGATRSILLSSKVPVPVSH
jgi:nucleotide-binding universal stress UspA family protein